MSEIIETLQYQSLQLLEVYNDSGLANHAYPLISYMNPDFSCYSVIANRNNLNLKAYSFDFELVLDKSTSEKIYKDKYVNNILIFNNSYLNLSSITNWIKKHLLNYNIVVNSSKKIIGYIEENGNKAYSSSNNKYIGSVDGDYDIVYKNNGQIAGYTNKKNLFTLGDNLTLENITTKFNYYKDLHEQHDDKADPEYMYYLNMYTLWNDCYSYFKEII